MFLTMPSVGVTPTFMRLIHVFTNIQNHKHLPEAPQWNIQRNSATLNGSRWIQSGPETRQFSLEWIHFGAEHQLDMRHSEAGRRCETRVSYDDEIEDSGQFIEDPCSSGTWIQNAVPLVLALPSKASVLHQNFIRTSGKETFKKLKQQLCSLMIKDWSIYRLITSSVFDEKKRLPQIEAAQLGRPHTQCQAAPGCSRSGLDQKVWTRKNTELDFPGSCCWRWTTNH